MQRGRQTKLSRGDSEMDGPYERRNETIKHLRGVLKRSPFVRARWGIGSKEVSLLLDTGAEVSLVDESVLTKDERKTMKEPDTKPPQGVSGEVINIVGTLTKTVRVGGQVVRNHKFFVVKNCIVKYLAGIDFIFRLGRATWDPKRGQLYIHETGQSTKLETMYRPESGTNRGAACDVLVKEDIMVEPGKECLVKCVADKAFRGLDYMAAPNTSPGDEPVRPACCIVRVDKNRELWLRVINVNKVSETLRKGEKIALLDPEFETTFPGQHMKTKPTDRVTGYKGDERLDSRKQEEVDKLLTEFSDVFWKPGDCLPSVQGLGKHCIRLKPDARPVGMRPRRLSPKEREEVNKEITHLLGQGLITQSTSPWAAPIVVARRKNGQIRLAIDYRALNAQSFDQHHPIPRIDDLIDRLGEAKYFSSLDLKSGYYQMPLREEDSDLTGFVTPDGQFQWTGRGTPFGLSGAPASFQRLMSGALGSLNWQVALCYLDDILVWGATWTEHMQRLRLVLQRLQEVGMLLNPEKCTFGVRRIEFLGHVIGEGMLSISDARREALINTPKPTTVTMLRKALGAFSYVQRWIPGMADIAKPLYDLLEKDGKKLLIWTPETTAAFERLKKQVTRPPALYLPDFTRRFVLVTDASTVGTGAMLAQPDRFKPDGPLNPVAFSHHTLSASERNYSTTDRELLAIVLAVKKFRVYLAGKRFDLITDHRALSWINESLDLNDVGGRRGRWLEFLQQYPFNPIHRAGKSPELAMADYLSRVGHGEQVATLCMATSTIGQAESDSAYRIFPMLARKDVHDAQMHCPAVGEYLRACEQQRELKNPINLEAKALWQARDRLTVLEDGILRYRNYKGRPTENSPLGKNQNLLVVLPQSLRRRFLQLVHDSPLGGHMGRDRTWDRVRAMVWWPGVKSDVAKYVAGCDVCQRVKHGPKGKAPLEKTDIPKQPFQRIQIDFVGPVQASVPEGFTYVLAIQDVLTRYVKLVAASDNSAETAVRVLIDEWITQFDIPEVISSDQGPHFTATVFEATCKELGIEHALGSPEHPQSQAQVERQNQLFANVRAVCNRNPASWPRAMHAVTFAHNTSANRTTGISPHELVFKQQARRPEAFFLPEDSAGSDEEWRPEDVKQGGVAAQARSDAKKLDDVFQLVKRKISVEQDRRKKRTKSAMKRPFEIGEGVRTRLTAAERNKLGGKKLADLKSKRFIVLERHGNTYKLQEENNPSGRVKQRHFNELELAPPQVLSWETEESDDQADNYESSSDSEGEPQPPRRSTRGRQPTKRLQVDWHQQQYVQREATEINDELLD